MSTSFLPISFSVFLLASMFLVSLLRSFSSFPNHQSFFQIQNSVCFPTSNYSLCPCLLSQIIVSAFLTSSFISYTGPICMPFFFFFFNSAWSHFNSIHFRFSRLTATNYQISNGLIKEVLEYLAALTPLFVEEMDL